MPAPSSTPASFPHVCVYVCVCVFMFVCVCNVIHACMWVCLFIGIIILICTNWRNMHSEFVYPFVRVHVRLCVRKSTPCAGMVSRNTPNTSQRIHRQPKYVHTSKYTHTGGKGRARATSHPPCNRQARHCFPFTLACIHVAHCTCNTMASLQRT